jgi:hypothetical protein
MRPAARTAAVIIATAGLALLTACGGSSSTGSGGRPSSTRTSSASSTGAGGASSAYVSQVLAFARCVRAHGVPNFPDPNSSGAFSKQALVELGVSKSRLRAAMAPCPFPARQAPLTARDQQDYLKAAACMRSHGIPNFPDPTFSGGSVNFPIPSSIDTTSEQFSQARQTCVKFIPAGLPYHGSGNGS